MEMFRREDKRVPIFPEVSDNKGKEHTPRDVEVRRLARRNVIANPSFDRLYEGAQFRCRNLEMVPKGLRYRAGLNDVIDGFSFCGTTRIEGRDMNSSLCEKGCRGEPISDAQPNEVVDSRESLTFP
ncbi:hypothetical protein CDL15_Pgr027846 [Punica granatum]|uniref:Uncharacterized protein n=1 Tax=Punica granatum TaxID=22663 RepID=A0A218XK44_PUNGR|nr:hypothetical protein CDL15_Pgr027846 [Punica granatum]